MAVNILLKTRGESPRSARELSSDSPLSFREWPYYAGTLPRNNKKLREGSTTCRQNMSKSPPTADLHHADVNAHTTPITATSSLNCTQYPTESKCNGFLLRHLDSTPKITIYYFVSELTWASIKINIIPPPHIPSINIVSICYM